MAAELIEIVCEPRDDTVIHLLESALKQARAGKLSSIGIAAVWRSGRVSAAVSDAPNAALQLAAAAVLQDKVMKGMPE